MSDATDPQELRRRLVEVEEELERFRLTLEVVGTVDLDSGILNRNGVLEALERGRRWLERRGDIYGLLVVWMPDLDLPDPPQEDTIELLRHLAATLSAGVREVDEVGRIDDTTFGAVLADLQPDSAQVVAERVSGLVEDLRGSVPQLGHDFRIGAMEVHSAEPTSPAVLEATLELVRSAPSGTPRVGKLS